MSGREMSGRKMSGRETSWNRSRIHEFHRNEAKIATSSEIYDTGEGFTNLKTFIFRQ